MRQVILRPCKLAEYFGFPPISKKLTEIRRVYPVLIYLIYVLFTMHCLFLRSTSYIQYYSLVQTITDVLLVFSEVFYMSACLLWPGKRLWYWRTFWNNLELLDKNLKKLNYQNKSNLAFHTGVISTCFVVVFLVHTYEVLNWYSNELYIVIYSYMNVRFVMYYQLLVVILMCYITRTFKLKLDFLKRYLHKVVVRKRSVLWNVPQPREARPNTFNEFEEISKLYATIYNSVKLFNNIFGWHIYFIIMTSVLEILSSVSFGMAMVYYFKIEWFLSINMLYTAIYLVFTVSVVLSCDLVEKSGRAFGEACVLLQQDIPPESSTRKELQFLAQFVKGLVLEITSAGFYNINQSVLSSIFSTAATYVIITLQFNKL